MSGDCPHRVLLAQTLQKYEQQQLLLTTTQNDYLKIIEELKQELDSLTTQFTNLLEDNNSLSTQKCNETTTKLAADNPPVPPATNIEENFHTDLMISIRALEQQNTLLQDALERATQHRADYCLELQEQNAHLKVQLQAIMLSTRDKDKLIAQQNLALERISVPKTTAETEALRSARTLLEDANRRIENLENELDRSRNEEKSLTQDKRNLNDELIDSKRRNGELLIQVERLRNSLRDSTENYTKLKEKYESLLKCYEGQTKKINELQQRIADLQTNMLHNKKETQLLHHQLTSLKEKEAMTTGEFKALQKRYERLENEQNVAQKAIWELHNAMKHKDEVHLSGSERQKEKREALEKQLNKTLEKLEHYQKEYQQIQEISEQKTKTIESYKKWKEEQLKTDASTKTSIAEYEYNLKLLTEQNFSCLDRTRLLKQENECLKAEVERLRLQSLSIKPGTFTPMSTRSTENLLSNRFEQLRFTTQRVLRKTVDLNNFTANATNDVTDYVDMESNLQPTTPSSGVDPPQSGERQRRPASANVSLKPP